MQLVLYRLIRLLFAAFVIMLLLLPSLLFICYVVFGAVRSSYFCLSIKVGVLSSICICIKLLSAMSLFVRLPTKQLKQSTKTTHKKITYEFGVAQSQCDT